MRHIGISCRVCEMIVQTGELTVRSCRTTKLDNPAFCLRSGFRDSALDPQQLSTTGPMAQGHLALDCNAWLSACALPLSEIRVTRTSLKRSPSMSYPYGHIVVQPTSQGTAIMGVGTQ